MSDTREAEMVLVVDDEPELTSLGREILEGQGYRVLTATSPEEALEIAERHEGPIHLLLTDVVMPVMSGPEMAGRFARRRRDTKVLYMSGFTEEIIADYGQLPPGAAFIAKPFSPQPLLQKIRQMLDYRSPFARPASPASPPRLAMA